jgi:hypothetical protein
MTTIVQSYSQYLTVSHSPGQYIGNNGQGAGQMRFNTTSQKVEAYDGNSWITLTSFTNVDTNHKVTEAMHWVHTKMLEENDVKQLAKKHKSVAAALENLNKAQEQLEITIHLSRESYETTS